MPAEPVLATIESLTHEGRALCAELNATETVFPRTNLRLVLQLGST